MVLTLYLQSLSLCLINAVALHLLTINIIALMKHTSDYITGRLEDYLDSELSNYLDQFTVVQQV